MQEKTKINEIIVVEGKSDTALLKSIFDCETIETNGFAISSEIISLIKKVNETKGVILFLDPDYPGMKIRDKITLSVPNCKQAFLNKEDAIGKGKVGVAEGDIKAIKKAILNCVSFKENVNSITWSEFLTFDIIGNKNRRDYLFRYFGLGYGNNKLLFKRMNMADISKEMIIEALKKEE
jgi:ribonuclease M5